MSVKSEQLKLVNENNYCFESYKNIRSISISRLKPSLVLHLKPINLVVSKGTYCLATEESYLKVGFPLRCFQWLSLPNLATRQCQ